MLIRIIICIFLFNISFTPKTIGQQVKIKFGNISKEELLISSYPSDTTAAAVILYDKGHFSGEQLTFKRHIRVKILKNSGTKWGNWVFDTPSKGDINGYVYNLIDGEIVKEKLKNSEIHVEQLIDDYYVYKVFMPNVKVGSIIDIQYSHPGITSVWKFQESIPIEYSELILEQSRYANFKKIQLGFGSVQQISPSKWVAKNMPAFKFEPFLNNYSNYITKFQIDLYSAGIPGRSYKEYNSSWERINNRLLDNERFGGILKANYLINEKAKELNKKDISVDEKILLAYEFIRESIKWNGIDAVLGSSDYRTNFKKDHSGKSSEINLLLISLLNRMKISTLPVVISTRDNGMLLQFSPSINQLNYVVAYVNHDNKNIFLDATSEKLIPGILPDKCLNGKGLIVEKDKANWVDLNNGYIHQRKQFVNIKINEDGTARANVVQKHSQYSYLEWIKYNDSEVDNQKYIQSIKDDLPNLIIDKYEIKKHDPKKLSSEESIDIDLTNHIINMDKELLICPYLISDYNDNPFKSEERQFPVDLTYPTEYSSVIIVDLPENYEIKNLPESIMLSNEDKSISLKIMVGSTPSKVQFQVNMKVEKALFNEVEYFDLRQFYTQLISKMSESIHLIKKS